MRPVSNAERVECTVEPYAGAGDLDGILAVEAASFTNPWTRDMYLAELENRGVSFFFVARDDRRRIVGFCAFWRVLDELHINNLAVLPESLLDIDAFLPKRCVDREDEMSTFVVKGRDGIPPQPDGPVTGR